MKKLSELRQKKMETKLSQFGAKIFPNTYKGSYEPFTYQCECGIMVYDRVWNKVMRKGAVARCPKCIRRHVSKVLKGQIPKQKIK